MVAPPGEIFSLPRNEFNPGDPADFFLLFDPEEEWMVKPGNLRSQKLQYAIYRQQICTAASSITG